MRAVVVIIAGGTARFVNSAGVGHGSSERPVHDLEDA